MERFLKTLIYKRTHRGDPDDSGSFGIHDCMGKVRGWTFDAVIGVGGKHPDNGHEDIAVKVNWVGIKPQEAGRKGRGPLLKFEFYYRFDEVGPDLQELAPRLFGYMFEDKHVRALLSQNLRDEKMQEEVRGVLEWAKRSGRFRKP